MRRVATRAAGLAALAAGLVVGAAGCGGGTSTVRGKVSSQGKTVVWGAVTLVSRTGMYHTGDIGLDGTYSIDKVPTGTVKIGVSSPNPEPTGGRGAAGVGGATPGKKGGNPDFEDPRDKFIREQGIKKVERPRPPAGAWFEIPKKYMDPNESGLTHEVKGGTTEINIELK